ncbi:MAG: type IV secretion system protein [Rickettsia sp.]|nr:type IV secretion system protein [Rickettsia sp.]
MFRLNIKFLKNIICIILFFLQMDILEQLKFASVVQASDELTLDHLTQKPEGEGLDGLLPKGEGTIRVLNFDTNKSRYNDTITKKDFSEKGQWKKLEGLYVEKGENVAISIDTKNLPKNFLGKGRPNLKPSQVKYILYRIDPRFDNPQVVVYEGVHDMIFDPSNTHKQKERKKVDFIKNDPLIAQDVFDIPANQLAVFHLKEIFENNSMLGSRNYNNFYFDNILSAQGGIAYRKPTQDLSQILAMEEYNEDLDNFSSPSPITKGDIRRGYLSNCGCELITDDEFKVATGAANYSDSYLAYFKNTNSTCKKCLDIEKIDSLKSSGLFKISDKKIEEEIYDKFYVKAQETNYALYPGEDIPEYKFATYLYTAGCFGLYEKTGKLHDCNKMFRLENNLDKNKREGLKCSNEWSTSGESSQTMKKEGYASCSFSSKVNINYAINNDTKNLLFVKLGSKKSTYQGDNETIHYGEENNHKTFENKWRNKDSNIKYSTDENADNKKNYKDNKITETTQYTEYKSSNNQCKKTILTRGKAQKIIDRRGLSNKCKLHSLRAEDEIAIIDIDKSNKEDCIKILYLDTNYKWGDFDETRSVIASAKEVNGELVNREYLNVSDTCHGILSFVGLESGFHTYTGAPSNQIVDSIANLPKCSEQSVADVSTNNTNNALNNSLLNINPCLYDNGSGFTINIGKSHKKEQDSEFAFNNVPINHGDGLKDYKRFFYYLNDSPNNLEVKFSTQLQIENMFLPKEINQFAKAWHHSDQFDANKFLHVLFLHFGSYLMRVELYDIQSSYEKIKLEYIFSDNKPNSNDFGRSIVFEVMDPKATTLSASAPGNLWYRISSVASNKSESLGIDSGTLVLNAEVTRNIDFFDKMIYKNIILYLSEQMQLAVAQSFTYLSNNSTLKSIATTITTLYIIFYGIFFITGIISLSAKDLIIRFLKITVVFAVFFNSEAWNFFNNHVFRIFLEGYSALPSMFINEENLTVGVEPSPFSWVDILLSRLFSAEAMNMLWHQMFDSFLYFIITMILFAGMIKFLIMIFRVTVEYLISFSMLAITISIAPLFFLLVLFEYTRQFFSQWIKMMFGFFLYASILILLVLLAETVFTTFFTRAIGSQELILHKFYLPINILFLQIKIPLFSFSFYHPQVTIDQTSTTALIYSVLFYISGNIYSKISSVVVAIIRNIFGLETYMNR